MTVHRRLRRWPASLGLMATLTSLAPGVYAGGFALVEHGASGLGNAYAGAAASSHDTSTLWFNPAGMTELEGRQTAVAGHLLAASTDFTNRGSSLNDVFGGGPVSGPDTASPGTTTVLPNFYYVAPINDRLQYGVGFGVPFGSSTEYDDDWVGRYTTTRSGINVLDINPSVAYRVNDKVRLGAGVSLQRFTGDLRLAVDSGAVCLGTFAETAPALCPSLGLLPGVQVNDGAVRIEGDSLGLGFNLGALFLPRPDTKIGVAYRHGVSHELEGDGDFTANEALNAALDGAAAASTDPRVQALATLFDDTGTTAEINLPATLMFSIAHQLDARWQLLADATWTGWSSFEEIRIKFDNPVQPESLSIQAYEDVWRLSAGANYRLNEAWLLRAGLAFDEEAIPSTARRTARIPGNDRTWYSFGAGYRISPRASLDFGFAHLVLDETPIDNPNPESAIGTTVSGVFDSRVNIASVQFNWQFQ